MLLSARLNRLPSRSLKVFPPKRLGESAGTFTTTETKSLQVESGSLLNTKPDKSDERLLESEGPTKAQLEVDISNLKFRKTKNKKKLESEFDGEFLGEEKSADKLSGQLFVGENLYENDENDSQKLSLGEFRSDFEKWLNANHLVQADESLYDNQGCCKKNESKDASCCDSMISSCNISECSEEDKEDRKSGRTISDWDEGQLREKCLQEKSDSYSSGCHSAAGSGSVVVSDSEGVSPSFKSPEVSQQDVFSLCDEHCDLESIDPSLLKFLSEDSCYIKEEQFQVVQKKKKLRTKPSANQNANSKCTNNSNSEHQHTNSLVSNRDKFTGLKRQVVDVVEISEINEKNSDFNNNVEINSNDNIIIDASISSPTCEIDKAIGSNTNEIIPKYSEDVNDRIVFEASAEISPVEKFDFSKDANESKWNVVVKGNKKTKHNQNVVKSDLAKQTDLSENQSKNSKQSTSQEQCGTEIQCSTSSSDGSRRGSTAETDNDPPKNNFVSEKSSNGRIVSFGTSCRDLDTFHSTGSKSPRSARNFNRIPPVKNQTLKQQRNSHLVHNPQTHNGRHFNLKQAQLFLMQAYNAIQKQKCEDSNSVVIYS